MIGRSVQAHRKPIADPTNYVETGYDLDDGLKGGRWMRGSWGVLEWVQIAPVEVVRRPANCGTESGYAAHRRAGEKTCADCRSAHSVASRLRQARKRVEAKRLESAA